MDSFDKIVYGVIHTDDIHLINQAILRDNSCVITDKDLSCILSDEFCKEYKIDILSSSFNLDIARGKRYNNIYVLSDIDCKSNDGKVSKLIDGALCVRHESLNSDNFQIIINIKRAQNE